MSVALAQARTGTARRAPLPDLWPPDDDHRLTCMDLDTVDLAPDVQALRPLIGRLARLADTIRPLQAADGTFLDDELTGLALRRSADLVSSVAAQLPTPLSEVAYLRMVALLDRRAHVVAATRHVSVLEQPLVLIAGPLSTWRSKSLTALHSVVASVPDAPLNGLVGRIDGQLPAVLERWRTVVGRPDLRLSGVPAFYVTNLFACGGEANTFPKHFSYFLPEDEGVKRAPEKKTLVYANVYSEQFQRISRPVAETTLAPMVPADPERDRATQLVWFRGHDVGHSLQLPATDYRNLRPLGLRTSVMLQEAIADVMGFLAAASEPWRRLAGDDDIGRLGTVFLSELLRYVRRGVAWFPDSGSAFLELSYLVANGFLVLRDGGLRWDADRLHEGMARLGRDLCHVVLDAELEPAGRLLADHAWRADHPLAGEVKDLERRTRHLPTALTYRQASASAGTEP